MDEAKLVDGLNGKGNLGHVETGDVLGKNFVFDEHGHEIATRQELHEHVQESIVLESRVQLDNPWAVGLGEDVTFSPDVCQLIFLELVDISICMRKAAL